MIDIIKKINSEKNIFSKKKLLTSLHDLQNQEIALKKRNLFENSNFFKKKLIAFELLVKNHYKYFNGLKSFIRDLLR